MLTVNKILPQGQGLSAVLRRRAASIALDWDVRQKSRFDAIDPAGRALGIFLPRGQVVRGGDVLVGEDGSLIAVTALPQPVMRVTTCRQHGSPFDLLRAAYHLGNRHVQLELTPSYLQFEPDHVLADMLRRMHLTVTEEEAPFEPEGGAYTSHSPHAHAHALDESAHAHAPAVAVVAMHRTRPPSPAHVHGPDCDHGH